MKAIKAIILILLIISNINGDDFSLNGFILYMQDNGGYDLIQ